MAQLQGEILPPLPDSPIVGPTATTEGPSTPIEAQSIWNESLKTFDGPPFHVIDATGRFILQEDAANNHPGEDGPQRCKVVAFIGAPKCGTSTLCNDICGTSFESSKLGDWTRTTAGIVAQLRQDLDTVALDIQSRQVGGHTFDRQHLVFALSLADVLVLNIQERQFQLQDEVYMDMLQEVLGLLPVISGEDHDSKTRLMIVLRDCDGFTDQNTYEELLDSHLSSTWTKVSENRSYQDRSFKTYLDTELIALPHQRFQSLRYTSGIESLRHRALDPSEEMKIWQPNYSKNIPAGRLAECMKIAWESATSRGPVPLSQLHTVFAVARRRRLFAKSLQLFRAKMEDNSMLVLAPSEFRERCDREQKECLENCFTSAGINPTEDSEREMASLRRAVQDTVHSRYIAYLDHRSRQTVELFRAGLREFGKGYDFRTFTLNLKDARIGRFAAWASQASPNGELGADFWEKRDRLELMLQRCIDQARIRLAEEIVDARVLDTSHSLRVTAAKNFRVHTPKLWDIVLKDLRLHLEQSLRGVQKEIADLGVIADDRDALTRRFCEGKWCDFIEFVHQYLEDSKILQSMMEALSQSIRDEEIKPGTELDSVCRQGEQEALNYLSLVSSIKPVDTTLLPVHSSLSIFDSESINILSEAQIEDIIKQFDVKLEKKKSALLQRLQAATSDRVRSEKMARERRSEGSDRFSIALATVRAFKGRSSRK